MSDRAPDFIGEVLGYRAWRVEPTNTARPRLFSIFEDFEWATDQWTFAECPLLGSGEGIPHERHHCGIYAARDRGHLVRQGYNDDEDDIITIGEVALAGDVIPAHRGWRAEKARPVRLWVAHGEWPLVQRLSEEYGVPVGLTNILAKGDRRGHRT